jgi:hypothetical protein
MKGFNLLLILFVLCGLPISGVTEKPDESLSETDKNEYIPHPPIYIHNNSGFTPENGVSAGNGTPENPYIIENLYIEGDPGISIEHTTAYFVIRHCLIVSTLQFTISMWNTSNGTVCGCTLFERDLYIHISHVLGK